VHIEDYQFVKIAEAFEQRIHGFGNKTVTVLPGTYQWTPNAYPNQDSPDVGGYLIMPAKNLPAWCPNLIIRFSSIDSRYIVK
jgi:hypothetical protein